MSDPPPDEWMQLPWPTERVRHLLLPRGAPYTCVTYGRGGKRSQTVKRAFGAGLLQIMGTSGSGKSTLANSLLAWATIHSPVPRPLCFVGMPDEWLQCLPDYMQDVAYTINGLDHLHQVERGSIVLIDDTGIHAAARRSMSGGNVTFSKYAQIARHQDVTLVVTAQAFRVIDFAADAVTEGCTLIKWYDLGALKHERSEIRTKVEMAQRILRDHTGNSSEACRPFYYCVEDKQLAKFPAPEWVLADDIGRPFGLLSQERLKEVLKG